MNSMLPHVASCICSNLIKLLKYRNITKQWKISKARIILKFAHIADNHPPDDDGTTLLRNNADVDLGGVEDGDVNYYSDHQNNNNNNRHLVEDAGPLPIIKPAHSPLR